MSTPKELFSDGVGQANFSGGMIRMDFVTLQPGENGQQPLPQTAFRLIMPPQGVLSAFNSMQQLLDKLTEAGVVQRAASAQK